LAERALALFREFGDRALEAYALICLGRLYCSLGNYARAHAWFDEALRVIGLIEPPEVEVEMEAVLPLALLCHHTANDRQALTYAERGWQIAQEHRGPHSQAYALIVTGHVLAGLDRLAEAAAAYQRALAFYAELGSAPLAATPRAGLAQIALIQGDLTQAQAQVEALLPVLADQPQAGLDQPFEIYLTCYRVLDALHDPRAATVAQAGQRLLHAYAESIPDPTLRRSFLENVAVHREIADACNTRS
jgi:tetratricopeptide (TPR) repeat protein